MFKNLKVACLYTASELSGLAERQHVTLTDDANRALLSIVMSKLHPAIGQKVVRYFVQKRDSGWGNEEFEVEAILDHSITENGEYYFIKWKNWSHSFNTWEPRSNLDCDLLIAEFHRQCKKNGHSAVSIQNFNDNGDKKSKIDELVKLLHYNGCLTAVSLVDALKQIKASDKVDISNSMGLKRKRKAVSSFINKRTKAYKLHVEEVHRALRDWERHLNSICTDPAPILVENYVDLEGPPQNFFYINDYMPGQGVTLDANPVVGCECTDCFKEKTSCCGCNAGTAFAYYANGCIRLPPGYPVYECNNRCRCGPECPNRVVQHGRRHRVCIFRTANGRGWGVKAMQKIKKGSFVMEYVGEVITNEEAEKRGQNYDANGMTYLFDLDYQDPDCPFTVDAGVYGNVSHFVNHSCDPNLTVYGVWINNLDPRTPRIALFASRDISKGEELTFDYMMTGDSTELKADAVSLSSDELHNTSTGASIDCSQEDGACQPNEHALVDAASKEDSLASYVNNGDGAIFPSFSVNESSNTSNSSTAKKIRIACQCGTSKCRKYLF